MNITALKTVILLATISSLTATANVVFQDSFESTTPPPNGDKFITYANVHQSDKVFTAPEFTAANRLKNPSFEQNGVWRQTCGKMRHDTQEKTDGARSLKISDANGCGTTSSYNYAISQGGITLDPNIDYYTVTFDIQFNKYAQDLVGSQTIQVFIDDKDHVSNDIFESDTDVTMYHKMTSYWRPVQFIISLDKIKSRLDNPNNLNNLSFTLKLGGIIAGEHIVHIDNLRLSPGRIDQHGAYALPSDLRNSQQRVAIKAIADGKKRIGSMTVGGKDVKLYKAFTGEFHTRPAYFGNDITVGHRYITEKLPGDGELPQGQTRFPVFSADVQSYNASGTENPNSPLARFLGTPGILNSDSSTHAMGLGYDYYGADYSQKANRAVFNVCAANYYDSAQIEPSSIYCGGKLTDASFNDIKNAKGESVLVAGTSIRIAPSGRIAALDGIDTISFYDKQGKSEIDIYADGSRDSQAWAHNSDTLAVLSSSGAGMIQKPGKDNSSSIPMLTIYSTNGSSLEYQYRYPLDFLTVGDDITWAVNDKYILYNRAYIRDKKTYRELWWLEVASGKRGQINSELVITGANTQP